MDDDACAARLRMPPCTPHTDALHSAYSREMNHSVLTPQSRSAFALTRSQLVSLLACCGTLGLFAGCVSAETSHVVSAPPPRAPTSSVTTTTTTETPAGPSRRSNASPIVSTTVVTQAPPALQEDTRIARPSRQHVWLAGYWSWRDDRYVWMAGHWDLPPTSRSVWTAPRWEQEGSDYRFYEGFWN